MEGWEMRLTEDNRAFLKKHKLTVNEAISRLAAQERDANENGGTILSEKKGFMIFTEQKGGAK